MASMPFDSNLHFFLPFAVALIQSCVLFQLLRFFRSCVVDDLLIWDYGGRREAEKIMLSEILPEGRKLLCTFDPSIVDAATGNNVLHEVAPLVPPKTVTPWIFGLVELFIAHGVSVHTRNQEGRTPLLQIASLVTPAHTSTAAMRLLLTHGTDLNVQDNDGNSLLHLLVKSKALPMLEDLLGGDGVSHIDCLLLNSAGQTAADLAAVQLAQLKADGGGAEAAAGLVWLHRLVLTYQKTWTACSRPILQRCVEAVLVPDLAALVLGYVDGGGKPFPAPSPTSAQKSSEAAATAGPPPAQ
jgi:hypothetical protein